MFVNLDRVVDEFFYSYPIGMKYTRYSSSDTDQVEKYVINPEWRKMQMQREVEMLERKVGYYDAQINQLISVKGEIKENLEKLKKELENFDIEKK